MGAWPFVLLSFSLMLMTVTGELLGKESSKPCLSWMCARKRALELTHSSEDRPCLTWQCKRDMLLHNKFLNALRAAGSVDKKSSIPESEEKPCISWSCRRKRRDLADVPQNGKPKPVPEDMPCLTGDCRTGKRSSVEDSGLMEKLRFARAISEPQNEQGCLSWHCFGRKRQAESANAFQ